MSGIIPFVSVIGFNNTNCHIDVIKKLPLGYHIQWIVSLRLTVYWFVTMDWKWREQQTLDKHVPYTSDIAAATKLVSVGHQFNSLINGHGYILRSHCFLRFDRVNGWLAQHTFINLKIHWLTVWTQTQTKLGATERYRC